MSFSRLISATFFFLFLLQNSVASQSIPMISVMGKAQGTTYQTSIRNKGTSKYKLTPF
jgi:hypothetical protein